MKIAGKNVENNTILNKKIYGNFLIRIDIFR